MYKLDKINRRILFELDRNARISDRQIAKIVRRSKESVRYRINKMTHDGVIKRFTVFIDPTKLGYQSAKIYFTLANIPEKKKEFINQSVQNNRLFWLGIAEGAWNAGMTFFVRDNEEFFDIKIQLFNEYKDLILDSWTASLIRLNHYGANYLYPDTSNVQTIVGKPVDNKIDALSSQVLHELFLNARTPVTHMAKKFNAPPEAVRSRMQKMAELGIIARYTIEVDFHKLGYEFYKTFLYFNFITKADLERMVEYARTIPQVRFLIQQISPWDVELEIMCTSYTEYNTIISKFTKEFADIIKRVETAIMSEDYPMPSKEFIFN